MRKIEILGPGCPKCQTLQRNAEAAVKESGLEAEIIKVSDLKQIMAYGVMMTPGLVVVGVVKSVGKVLTVQDIKTILENAGDNPTNLLKN